MRNRIPGKTSLIFLALLVGPLLFAGCESGPSKISFSNPKAEMSQAIIGEAMVMMNIRNEGGADVLTRVKTDIPGAKATLHVMKGERMVETDSVKVPAHGNVEFKMGGSHIMIENMPKDMKAGSKFNLTLDFQKSGIKQVPLTLEPATEKPMDDMHM